MNKKIAIVTAALLLVIAAFAFYGKQKVASITDSSPSAKEEAATSPETATNVPSPAPTSGGTGSNAPGGSSAPAPAVPSTSAEKAAESPLAQEPLSAAEKDSAKKLMASLILYVQPAHSSPQEMINGLKNARLEPVVAKDFNNDTGKMLIIHTNKTLPGTRCYHAQYFEDEHKKNVVQHVSFQLRPNKGGMAEAKKLLETELRKFEDKAGKLGKPTEDTPTFVSWNLKNNYSAWIKKLSAEDFKDGDPFCAHDPATDIGTFRVAIEEIPEDEDEE